MYTGGPILTSLRAGFQITVFVKGVYCNTANRSFYIITLQHHRTIVFTQFVLLQYTQQRKRALSRGNRLNDGRFSIRSKLARISFIPANH